MIKDGHGDILSVYGSNGTTKLAGYIWLHRRAANEVCDQPRYDAFGNQLTTSGTWAASNPIRYCGEYYDTETGLIYLRARYYDSESGRFITEDPAKDGYNWYSYCAGNPVMFVDPSGLINFSANSRYEYNRHFDINGYIYGQSVSPVGNMEYGIAKMKNVGCELIAIHNALFALGDGKRLSDITAKAEMTSGVMWACGIFGSHPDKLGELISAYGHNYCSTENREEFNSMLKSGGVYIVSFWTNSNQIHTVMFTYEQDGSIKIYNYYDDDTETRKFTDPSDDKTALDTMLECQGEAIILYKVE